MGRKPIGDAPMTGAERVRRYRLMHPTESKATTDATIRELRASLDALERRLANRDEHIRELEARLARMAAPASKRG